jgi:calpain, invertebrate
MDNSFSDEDYCGLFHFRFWIYGTWYDVCIDDYLPVGPNGDLNFCHNKVCKSEFWCALLEKAYAKVNGSYEALEGGFTTDALVDMSGGVEEKFNLKEIKYKQKNEIDSLWLILTQAKKKKSVICCNLEPDELVADFKMSNGLVKGHAYVVTTLANVTTSENKKFRLLKCHK